MNSGNLIISAIFISMTVSTWIAPTYAEWLALVLMIGAGIPHGSCDLRVAKLKWRTATLSPVRTIFYYLACVCTMSTLCLILPLAGLSLFLLISALHFSEGEAHSDKAADSLRSFLFGIGAILLPIGLHLDQTQPYVSFFVSPSLFNDLRPILGLLAWVSVALIVPLLITDLIKKRDIPTTFQRSVCLAGWLLLPPLAGFAVWFIGRHSRQHIELCRTLFGADGKRIPLDFLAISLLAIAGLLPFMLLFDFSDINQVFAASICLIAGLTLPHMIVSHNIKGLR